jgi:hypothetical protein
VTRRDLLLIGTEVKLVALLEAAAFTVGFVLTFPFALRAALRRYRRAQEWPL